MRPLFVVILTVLILGGVKVFIDSDEGVRSSADNQPLETIQSEQKLDVEIWLSFDAGPDEFSLELSDAPSLILQLNGREILKRTDAIPASQSPIRIENVTELTVGKNEFLVQASPSVADSRPKSLQLRILRTGNAVAQETIWARPGDAIQGSLQMEIAE